MPLTVFRVQNEQGQGIPLATFINTARGRPFPHNAPPDREVGWYWVDIPVNSTVTVRAPYYEDQIRNIGELGSHDIASEFAIIVTLQRRSVFDCFIATAASGGPNSNEVQFLREIRDNILLKTRTGQRLFSEFYSHYYQFSPAIAEEMYKDPNFKHAMNWALVRPLLNYYKLAVTRPDWNLENAPARLREYLENLGNDMDAWLSEIPIPHEFESLAPEEAALELSVVLRFILKHPVKRRSYLEDLTRAGVLPLRGEKKGLALADQNLMQSNVSLEERSMILGYSS